eukprot:6102146-Alexandrium_andersonii.AAC.1
MCIRDSCKSIRHASFSWQACTLRDNAPDVGATTLRPVRAPGETRVIRSLRGLGTLVICLRTSSF